MGQGEVTIRLAEARDDDAVGELLVSAFVEQYARKMPEVQVTDRRKRELRDVAAKRAVARVFVAERDGRVVGTVALWAPGASGSEAWLPGAFDLRHLAVAEEARGLGVADRLIETCEREALDAGGQAVVLHVRRGATGVARVYQRRGYQRSPEGDRDLLPEVFLEAFVRRLTR